MKVRSACGVLGALSLSGCVLVQTHLIEAVPEVRLRALHIRHLTADPVDRSVRLGIELVLGIRNPYSIAMPVLPHALQLDVGSIEDVASIERPGFEVGPQQWTEVTYPLTLQVGGAQSSVAEGVLGKRVPFALRADVFAEIPEGQLTTLEGVHPVLAALALDVNEELTQYPLSFRHDGELRLTRFPAWALLPPEVEMLGEVSELPTDVVLDLIPGPVEQGIEDVLALSGDAQDLAIGALEGLGVDVPPVATLEGVWETLQSGELALLGLHGIRVTLPVELTNENEWPIHVPLAASSVFASDAADAPLTAVRLSEGDEPLEIPAGETGLVALTGVLDWGQLQDGLVELLANQAMTVRLRGETAFDLGYGSVRLEFDESVDVDQLLP